MADIVSNPLCQCGCNQQVSKPTNRYIKGHYLKVHWNDSKRMERENMKIEALLRKQRLKYLTYSSDKILLDTYSRIIDNMVKGKY